MPSSIPTRPEAIDALSTPDQEYVREMEGLPMPTYDLGDPAATIDFLRMLLSRPRMGDKRVREHEIKNYRTARNGDAMGLYVFEQAEAATVSQPRKLPVVVLFHGGGYTVGAPRSVADPARSLVLSTHHPCIVVAPQYLLAPENPFPASHIDAYDFIDQFTREFAALQADGGSFAQDILGLLPGIEVELRSEHGGAFIVGGMSAGATLTCALSHLVRDVAEPPPIPITGLYLGCPSPLPTPESVPEQYRDRYLARSSEACTKGDPVLPVALVQIFQASLNPDPDSPLYAPFHWPDVGESVAIPGSPLGEFVVKSSASDQHSISGHAGLPPTYLQVCGRDRARDDGLLYAAELLRHGVRTRVDVYAGLPHMFWALFGTLAATRRWQADTVAGIAWLLDGGDGTHEADGGCSKEEA